MLTESGHAIPSRAYAYTVAPIKGTFLVGVKTLPEVCILMQIRAKNCPCGVRARKSLVLDPSEIDWWSANVDEWSLQRRFAGFVKDGSAEFRAMMSAVIQTPDPCLLRVKKPLVLLMPISTPRLLRREPGETARGSTLMTGCQNMTLRWRCTKFFDDERCSTKQVWYAHYSSKQLHSWSDMSTTNSQAFSCFKLEPVKLQKC